MLDRVVEITKSMRLACAAVLITKMILCSRRFPKENKNWTDQFIAVNETHWAGGGTDFRVAVILLDVFRSTRDLGL